MVSISSFIPSQRLLHSIGERFTPLPISEEQRLA
jgi:hypothetical protein